MSFISSHPPPRRFPKGCVFCSGGQPTSSDHVVLIRGPLDKALKTLVVTSRKNVFYAQGLRRNVRFFTLFWYRFHRIWLECVMVCGLRLYSCLLVSVKIKFYLFFWFLFSFVGFMGGKGRKRSLCIFKRKSSLATLGDFLQVISFRERSLRAVLEEQAEMWAILASAGPSAGPANPVPLPP